MFFAGLWVPEWTSTRKLKDRPTTDNFYAFLTCEPNAEVAAIHPKAMPGILTDADEWRAWLNAPWQEVSKLQRPLPNGTLTGIQLLRISRCPHIECDLPPGSSLAVM